MGADGSVHREPFGDGLLARDVPRVRASAARRRNGCLMTTLDEQTEPAEGKSTALQTILLLDDDANTLLVLRCVLEPTGARVIECEDERSAARACEELAG